MLLMSKSFTGYCFNLQAELVECHLLTNVNKPVGREKEASTEEQWKEKNWYSPRINNSKWCWFQAKGASERTVEHVAIVFQERHQINVIKIGRPSQKNVAKVRESNGQWLLSSFKSSCWSEDRTGHVTKAKSSIKCAIFDCLSSKSKLKGIGHVKERKEWLVKGSTNNKQHLRKPP